MKKITDLQKENIKLGLELLSEENTTLSKIDKLTTMLRNTDPKIDGQLEVINKIIEKIQVVQEGDVIGLSAENLPEKTKEQKKRKKLIILLISSWDSLKSEVTRLDKLYSTASTTGALKVLTTLKGPLGLITIAAAAIVGVSIFLNNKSVEINVKNSGCPAIHMVSEISINIPGFSLPSGSIESGNTEVIKIPGVDVEVNIRKSGGSSFTALGFGGKFSLPSRYTDVIFDGESLMNRTTTLSLSENKTHDLVLKCES